MDHNRASFLKIFLSFLIIFFGVLHDKDNIIRESYRVSANLSDTLYFWIDPSFPEPERYLSILSIRTELTTKFQLRIKQTFNRNEANIRIHNWDSNNIEHSNILGFYRNGTGEVYINTREILSQEQFQAVVLHEIGHWLGMRHICLLNEFKEGCSAVGQGEAIMNPSLDVYPRIDYSDLDVREFRRVNR